MQVSPQVFREQRRQFQHICRWIALVVDRTPNEPPHVPALTAAMRARLAGQEAARRSS